MMKNSVDAPPQDKDGRLSLEEAFDHISSLEAGGEGGEDNQGSKQEMKRDFDQMDHDKDGLVSPMEMAKYIYDDMVGGDDHGPGSPMGSTLVIPPDRGLRAPTTTLFKVLGEPHPFVTMGSIL